MKRRLILFLLAVLAAGVLAPRATAQDVATPPAPALPRQARWARVDITYRAANVRHPALYCDSRQEKLRHDDAAHRGPLGLAAALAYEYVQFPAQLILTPVLVALKPPWTMETGQP